MSLYNKMWQYFCFTKDVYKLELNCYLHLNIYYTLFLKNGKKLGIFIRQAKHTCNPQAEYRDFPLNSK